MNLTPSRIITLMTDFGTNDHYVGVMKGVILSINPQAQIVDITHTIPPQDIHGAAFLIDSAYRYFPTGTIHLIVVDPGVGSERRAIVCQTQTAYFVCPDNGIVTHLLHNEGLSTPLQSRTRLTSCHRLATPFMGETSSPPLQHTFHAVYLLISWEIRLQIPCNCLSQNPR